uniref:Ornithine decarboxylase n=1 Tax=Panagrolaimus davidi TaxID=227884 RepID=A0A914P7S6_9BILA
MVLLKSFFVFFVVFVQSSLGAPPSRKKPDLPKAAYYERIGNSKVFVFKSSINSTVFSQIIGNDKNRKNDDSPFYTVNLGTLVSKFQEWQREMPRVKPFYSVKTNNEPVILSTLATLGSGFDCASKNEMNMILGNNKLTTPENIIFAHTIKPEKFISHADKMGINKMTFDNEEELYKVKKFHSNPRMVLRINVSDQTAAHKLGAKFGSNPITDAPKLLKKAAELGLEVIGISFHIGSGATKEETYGIGIKYARDLFDKGLELGHNMTLLDIGGGYPGNDTDEEISLQKIAKVVNTALDKYFPESGNYEIIAEPGRYFATAPVSVTANIVSSVEIKAERITKKPTDSNITAYSYYLNDGVYGTFACKVADFCPTISSFPLFPKNNQTQYISAVWGPTCSDSDLIEEQTNLPHMEVGEWLYYPYMGAYSIVLATDFNGFERAKGYYCIDEKSLQYIKSRKAAKSDLLSVLF